MRHSTVRLISSTRFHLAAATFIVFPIGMFEQQDFGKCEVWRTQAPSGRQPKSLLF
jgi:hypothetical protein